MTASMLNNVSATRIKKLSPLLINQLAAGEVVTRPAAVVKELLENAIDAGATHIEVRITQGGMGMIEVMDNGSGIHPDDMIMAITRHATSKVADVATLQGINTLGFRGEALSAMAAVSRLTLISSHDDSGVGRQLQVAGVLADKPKLTPVVHQQGTTVTVKDLYFNVPARRGNLKSIGTEFAHIETMVREVALARADVALNLSHDNKKRLSLSSHSIANKSHTDKKYLPLSRLEQALGMELTADAIDINVDLSSLLQSSVEILKHDNQKAKISGWLWVNGQSQPQLPKLLYVNGRLIKEPLISNQLRQLASNAQFDSICYALYFNLPTQWLNVNVHPTKQRIKISPLNNIMAHLSHTIGLRLKSLLPNINKPVDTNSRLVLNVDDITDSRLPDSSNHNISPNQRLDKEISNKSGEVDYSVQIRQSRQQVAAPQSQYKSNATQDLAINQTKTYRKTPILLPLINNKIPLPYCLQVLNGLPDGFDNGIFSNTDKGQLEQGLLFYSQDQCLLITQQNWQDIWQTLDNDKTNFTTQSESSYLAEQPLLLNNAEPIDALLVNQKINHYATRLSAQQLYEFSSELEHILKTYAAASINTEQLLNVMLSSTSQ